MNNIHFFDNVFTKYHRKIKFCYIIILSYFLNVYMRIGCIASHKNDKSTKLLQVILEMYPDFVMMDGLSTIGEFDLDVIIALGGDGFVLRVLHKIITYSKTTKVYGINCGNLGFLLNNFDQSKGDLIDRIYNAIPVKLSPLKVEMEDRSGKTHSVHAINEISLIRQTYQAVSVKVTVDGVVKLYNLVGDGVLLATGAGSAAYNLSAGGVIVPLESHLLTMTAINPFRPRGWHRAILLDKVVVEFEVLDDVKRPVLACADFHQFYFIRSVKASIDKNVSYHLLFDEESHLGDKIMDEQFLHCS